MALISSSPGSTFIGLSDKLTKGLERKESLEKAAQVYTELMYSEFSESIILARLFLTVPFVNLPNENKDFVMNLAKSAEITDLINDQTLVLSLMGTSGIKPEWNERKKSKGHIGIPMASSDFIEEIPMMSRLLKQVGVDLSWIEKGDSHIVSRTFGQIGGVFYVEDAKTEVDTRGRKIIAAQDFVEAEGVKTVFGIAGGYIGGAAFAVTIIFLREVISKEFAERFLSSIIRFKTNTNNLMNSGKLFSY